MLASQNEFVFAYLTQLVAPGATLLRRSVAADKVFFVDLGRVVLGVAAPTEIRLDAATAPPEAMEHQLGVVVGPAWLEANAAVLGLPSAVDAPAETEVAFAVFRWKTVESLLWGALPWPKPY